MENEKDLLDPTDFEDEVETESTDGKEDEVETEDEESTSNEDEENAKTQSEDLEEKEPERNLEKDASYAEKRRERERKEKEQREAKIREEAKLEGQLSVLKTNPYTNKKIVDAEGLKIYEIQKKLDEEGLDPIEDLPERLVELEREKRIKAEKETKEQDEFTKKIQKDLAEFRKEYPNVNTKSLAEDEEYMRFAEDKVGRWTTKEIYEAYQLKKNNSAKEKKAMTEKESSKIAEKITKNPSSAPSGNISPKSVENMTEAEFKEYWRKKYGE